MLLLLIGIHNILFEFNITLLFLALVLLVPMCIVFLMEFKIRFNYTVQKAMIRFRGYIFYIVSCNFLFDQVLHSCICLLCCTYVRAVIEKKRDNIVCRCAYTNLHGERFAF